MFKVGVNKVGAEFALTITNSRGRKWQKTVTEGCPGNAAEAAMVLQEYLDDGNKIKAKDFWREVS